MISRIFMAGMGALFITAGFLVDQDPEGAAISVVFGLFVLWSAFALD